MPITVIVRSPGGSESRLTFDGTQRIVLGRGSSCDVRLPDPSVSSRHALLRPQGNDYVLVDEGSTNGTFVGDVRIAPRTSRMVRSGERARLGRVWIELRVEQLPATRDLAAATLDMARAMVADALGVYGDDATLQVRVVESPAGDDASIALTQEGRAYVVGRAADCDLPLADPDASRQHVEITRKGTTAYVRDLGGKNGSWLGEQRIPADAPVPWKGSQVVQVGRTVLSLREPVSEALARIESAPDEAVAEEAPPPPPPVEAPPAVEPAAPASSSAPVAVVPSAPPPKRRGRSWGSVEFLTMAAAFAILALSLAGIVWLLKG